MMKGMMKRGDGLRDVTLFGRVVSMGLAVAGYAFLGAWAAGWLDANGYPSWAALGAMIASVAFGLWQGWAFLTRQTRREREGRGAEERRR